MFLNFNPNYIFHSPKGPTVFISFFIVIVRYIHYLFKDIFFPWPYRHFSDMGSLGKEVCCKLNMRKYSISLFTLHGKKKKDHQQRIITLKKKKIVSLLSHKNLQLACESAWENVLPPEHCLTRALLDLREIIIIKSVCNAISMETQK